MLRPRLRTRPREDDRGSGEDEGDDRTLFFNREQGASSQEEPRRCSESRWGEARATGVGVEHQSSVSSSSIIGPSGIAFDQPGRIGVSSWKHWGTPAVAIT